MACTVHLKTNTALQLEAEKIEFKVIWMIYNKLDVAVKIDKHQKQMYFSLIIADFCRRLRLLADASNYKQKGLGLWKSKSNSLEF